MLSSTTDVRSNASYAIIHDDIWLCHNLLIVFLFTPLIIPRIYNVTTHSFRCILYYIVLWLLTLLQLAILHYLPSLIYQINRNITSVFTALTSAVVTYVYFVTVPQSLDESHKHMMYIFLYYTFAFIMPFYYYMHCEIHYPTPDNGYCLVFNSGSPCIWMADVWYMRLSLPLGMALFYFNRCTLSYSVRCVFWRFMDAIASLDIYCIGIILYSLPLLDLLHSLFHCLCPSFIDNHVFMGVSLEISIVLYLCIALERVVTSYVVPRTSPHLHSFVSDFQNRCPTLAYWVMRLVDYRSSVPDCTST